MFKSIVKLGNVVGLKLGITASLCTPVVVLQRCLSINHPLYTTPTHTLYVFVYTTKRSLPAQVTNKLSTLSTSIIKVITSLNNFILEGCGS